MRDFIRISETVADGYTPIGLLPDEDAKRFCCEAFNRLADLQRGQPEMMGGATFGNPNLHPNGTGLYTYATEHVGDLTHRMAEPWATNKDGSGDFGYEFVNEKVSRMLRYMRAGYGFERDIREQVKRNFEYEQETKGTDATFAQWWTDLEEAGLRYAAEHAKLPVYNEAQHTARSAAVFLGEMDFHRSQIMLERLEEHLRSTDDWINYASLVRVKNRVPVPFSR
jgi:hypothetical protein